MEKLLKKILDFIFLPLGIIAVFLAATSALMKNMLWPEKKSGEEVESNTAWFLYPHLFKRKMSNRTYILILIIFVLIIGGFLAWQYFGTPKPVACTEEAKVCPDGSAVGRTGPNCEFTACPTVKPDETADWQIYSNNQYGFEIKYPKNLTTFGGAYNGLSFPDDTKIYISVSDNLSVLLPGTFGGYLIYTEISPPQSFVFTEEYLNFHKDYFIAYGGMGSWDTVINARQYKNGVFYVVSLNAEFIKGSPDTAQKKEELINSALSEMKNENNEYVKVFNQILSTFNFID